MFPSTHASVGQNAGRARLRNESCELRIRRLPVRNPKSEIRNRIFRPGISLVEVLIAMGILTIGLLGVAALFPVGAFYMQKGDVADRGSAVAQAAFNEAVTRGWLNPENWLVWGEGAVSGVANPSGVANSTFDRPFAEMLRRQKAYLAGTGWAMEVMEKQTTLEFGSVFVIDPQAIAAVAIVDSSGSHSTGASMRPGGVFPSSTVWTVSNNGGISTTPYAKAWNPWADTNNSGPRWPIRRVTLRQPVSASPLYAPLDPAIADKLFSSSDDLAMDLPTARDKPSSQRMDLSPVALNLNGSKGDPLARQSRGDYSWIITVSPNTAEARDALATDPSAFSYEVSVVVFYKRPLPRTRPRDNSEATSNLEQLYPNERGAQAKIVSTGLNGGEVLLTRIPMNNSTHEPAESPFSILKTGQWIMLCGPHPNSTEARPMMTARWYRVLAIDGKDSALDVNGITTDPSNQRLVSLRGPQWPWLPAANLATNSELSNALYVCIPTGAVAVHSKTIHFEGNSVWSGGASGLSAPPPPGPRYSF